MRPTAETGWCWRSGRCTEPPQPLSPFLMYAMPRLLWSTALPGISEIRREQARMARGGFSSCSQSRSGSARARSRQCREKRCAQDRHECAALQYMRPGTCYEHCALTFARVDRRLSAGPEPLGLALVSVCPRGMWRRELSSGGRVIEGRRSEPTGSPTFSFRLSSR